MKEQEKIETGNPSSAKTEESNYTSVHVTKQAVAETVKKLSYKEKREVELLEKEISELGKEKSAITEKLNSADTSFEELQKLSLRIGDINALLDEKELRWLELSEAI